ncbi:MAG: hypothetical protein HYS58_04140, partial [Elusimicrobia bacterium]|nr:hypothetical protein [Elusimicrobiota bacterium]
MPVSRKFSEAQGRIIIGRDAHDLNSVLQGPDVSGFLAKTRGNNLIAFDSAIFFDVLNFVDYEDVVRQAVQILKPDGRLIISNMAGAGRNDLFALRGVKRNNELVWFLEQMGLEIELYRRAPENATVKRNTSMREFIVVRKKSGPPVPLSFRPDLLDQMKSIHPYARDFEEESAVLDIFMGLWENAAKAWKSAVRFYRHLPLWVQQIVPSLVIFIVSHALAAPTESAAEMASAAGIAWGGLAPQSLEDRSRQFYAHTIRSRLGAKARALRLIAGREPVHLLPELPEYADLPPLAQTKFDPGLQLDLLTFLKENSSLLDVILGLRPMADFHTTATETSARDLQDLLYALHLYQHMMGVSIRLMRRPKLGNSHSPIGDYDWIVYDEDVLRSRVPKKDYRFAATRKGLEFLIARDIARGSGSLYESLSEPLLLSVRSHEVLDKPDKFAKVSQRRIQEIYVPTYDRPDGLDRALTALTFNLSLFGHRSTRVVVVDDSQGEKEQRNLEVIQKFQDQGYDVIHISRDQKDMDIENVSESLTRLYRKQLKGGVLDPRLQAQIITGDRVDKSKVQKMVSAAFARNIGGVRNYVAMVSQGKKMGGMDDDALPFTRVYDRARYFQLLSQRESQVQGHLGELYRSLGAILGRDVLSETSFYRLIGEMESAPERFDGASLEEARQLLEHYFAYDPDGDGGVVPRVAGQIVPRGVEKRLRFDDMVEEGLPNSLVTVEDTATTSHDQLPSIQDQNYVSIPVDVWGVFAETMESPIGSSLGGHLFTRDRRGIAGVPAQEIPDGTVMAVAGHFGGDRDLNALALIREAVRMWREEGGVNLRYLQQVVKKAIFVDLKGCVSTLMHNANQFCFNMTSVDNTQFSIPTTGGWLRIEEPFQASLFKFLFGKFMAWARVAGGHDRIPIAKRPNLSMQSFWETMALALYKDLDSILFDQQEKLREVTDPAERIRSLGQSYLE